MGDDPSSDHPVDPKSGKPGFTDAQAEDWTAATLDKVARQRMTPEAYCEQRLDDIERSVSGMEPAAAIEELRRRYRAESEAAVRNGILSLMADKERERLEQKERAEVEYQHRVDGFMREQAWTSRWSVTRLIAAGAVVVVLAAMIIVSALAGSGELSRAADEPVATSPTVTSPAATSPDTASPGTVGKPPSTEELDVEPNPQPAVSGDPYLEARAALGLSTTTPASVDHINAGAGPMLYELSWVDGAEAPRAELGSIGIITLARDDAMEEGGRATLDGSDSVGAYVIGKAAGQLNIGVRIAIRVPGPDGGDPQLIIFSLENTEGSSLVGTAKPVGGDDPDPPWYVLGERR